MEFFKIQIKFIFPEILGAKPPDSREKIFKTNRKFKVQGLGPIMKIIFRKED